jgi:EKC/KEOPS complex subunit CGI121/TPRKB
VFRLSPNNNIGESYKRFGISDTSPTLIAVKLPLSPSTSEESTYAKEESITNESVSKHLGSVVEGTSVPVGEEGEELGSFCEVDKVRKVYKLGGGDQAQKGKKGGGAVNWDAGETDRKEMESVILGIMALKGS